MWVRQLASSLPAPDQGADGASLLRQPHQRLAKKVYSYDLFLDVARWRRTRNLLVRLIVTTDAVLLFMRSCEVEVGLRMRPS